VIFGTPFTGGTPFNASQQPVLQKLVKSPLAAVAG